jgi:hypothetical protein
MSQNVQIAIAVVVVLIIALLGYRYLSKTAPTTEPAAIVTPAPTATPKP